MSFTLHQHLSDHVGSSCGLTDVILSMANVGQRTRHHLMRVGLGEDEWGSSGQKNESGDDVQILDVRINQIMKDILQDCPHVAVIGSEEESTAIQTRQYNTGQYVVLFDPLDGSGNIGTNTSMGTIFSIYNTIDSAVTPDDHCLQMGRQQVAAGYIIYGSSVTMVYTVGKGVHGFTYDPDHHMFIQSHDTLRLPDYAQYYSVNESLYNDCSIQDQQCIDQLRATLSLRYGGALVVDVHRNILKGGIYIYPATKQAPIGKLRLVYEANPLAFIMDQAGGRAINGTMNILDVQPTALHQRIPLYIGASDWVDAHQVRVASDCSVTYM